MEFRVQSRANLKKLWLPYLSPWCDNGLAIFNFAPEAELYVLLERNDLKARAYMIRARLR